MEQFRRKRIISALGYAICFVVCIVCSHSTGCSNHQLGKEALQEAPADASRWTEQSPTPTESKVDSTTTPEKQTHPESTTPPEKQDKLPRSPRDLSFYNITKVTALTLSQLKWREVQRKTLSNGVLYMTGTFQGWTWNTFDTKGRPIQLPWRQAVYLFLPPSLTDKNVPKKALLYSLHDALMTGGQLKNVDQDEHGVLAAQIAKDFQIPVALHGWDSEVVKPAGSNSYHEHQFPLLTNVLLKQFPCSSVELPFDGSKLINGSPLTKGNIYAITAVQRLVEKEGGKVNSVGSVGISKEGWAHWILSAVDPRVEVAAPGGHHMQDIRDTVKGYIDDWNCKEPYSSGSAELVNVIAGLHYWFQQSPIGKAADRVSNVIHFKDKLYPRFILVNGDLTKPGQHDRPFPLGAENKFLSNFTEKPWRYWRIPDKGGVGRLTETHRGKAMLAAVAENLVHRTPFMQIELKTEIQGRKFRVSVKTTGAVSRVQVFAAASSNRWWTDPGQGDPGWSMTSLKQSQKGLWISKWSGTLPANHEAAVYAEAQWDYKRGENTYFYSASTPVQFLFRLPANVCTPKTPIKTCK